MFNRIVKSVMIVGQFQFVKKSNLLEFLGCDVWFAGDFFSPKKRFVAFYEIVCFPKKMEK